MLKDKQDLSELELKWEGYHDTNDSEKERNVLEQLCPPKSLKSLTIINYVGTKFPNWLGDPSFRNMVSIMLKGCKNCFICPPLGQLPYLKKLEIEGFMGEKVGPEFYGNDSSAIEPRFRCLEYLSFEKMQEWEEWVIFEGEVFPRLQQLYINNCPKLSGGLPNGLPSLTKLKIKNCKQLVASLPKAPALQEFYVDAKIQLTSGYPSLESININGDGQSLWSFPLELFSKLKSITMYNCENLNSFSAPALLPALVTLRLEECPELESFPEEGLPSNLERLHIINCDKLISRRREWRWHSLRKLREFRVGSNCEESGNFPEVAWLPSILTHFQISFRNLKLLNGRGFQHLTSLKRLDLACCNELQCLPKEGLPTSLSELTIIECPLLEKRCEKERGKDWGKIAAIPFIVINYTVLQSPS